MFRECPAVGPTSGAILLAPRRYRGWSRRAAVRTEPSGPLLRVARRQAALRVDLGPLKYLLHGEGVPRRRVGRCSHCRDRWGRWGHGVLPTSTRKRYAPASRAGEPRSPPSTGGRHVQITMPMTSAGPRPGHRRVGRHWPCRPGRAPPRGPLSPAYRADLSLGLTRRRGPSRGHPACPRGVPPRTPRARPVARDTTP